MAGEQRPIGWLWLWVACYLALLGAVVWSLYAARRWALAELSTPQSVSDWQAWRSDVQQHRAGPVERRVPKSLEPPAVVLMRDYFGVALGGAVVFSSVLYWVIAWFVTGALTPPTTRDRSPGSRRLGPNPRETLR